MKPAPHAESVSSTALKPCPLTESEIATIERALSDTFLAELRKLEDADKLSQQDLLDLFARTHITIDTRRNKTA